MTDYFSNSPNSIVVCSNGGCQRGHTVITPKGIGHIFHHFGSGTFNKAATYLSEDFILNPMIFKQEYDRLGVLGYTPTVYANDKCMITTPYDMMANQIIEEDRGFQKHGSCGMGIYETIKRYNSGVWDFDRGLIREYYLDEFRINNVGWTNEWRKLFWDDDIFEHYMEDLEFMKNHFTLVKDDNFLNVFDNIIFEAGQGLVLDQNNKEYYPHLTPSNTGIKNPKRIIENIKWDDDINIETCYVSRTYLTRHGKGYLPNERNKGVINRYMFDKTNVPNPFQDALRYGLLNLKDLYERCSNDVGDFGDIKSLALTHCNEYDWNNDKLIELFKDWNIYYSDGETHNDVDMAI